MKKEPKIAVMEVLAEMDNFQAEKVLRYARLLLGEQRKQTMPTEKFRRQAMREIRSALRQERGAA